MPPISLLIKPASGNCNMRCRYCFYEDETDKRAVKSYGVMSHETMETLIWKTLSFADRECTFAFQGGEPTLAGLDFFHRFVELVERYNCRDGRQEKEPDSRRKVAVHYAIQTNGYGITDQWAAFFARWGFLVGLSLDGPKEINDRYRLDAAGEGSYKRIMRAAQLFDKYRVEYNILTVVTAQTAKNIGKIYGFFDKNHFVYQQYIPCLDPIGEERGRQEYSLTPECYERFLKDLFDLWYRDRVKGKFVYNRYFENLAAILKGYAPENCGMKGYCDRQLVVEADGSVYPCDFYALDEWKLGNLVTESFEELEEARRHLGFVELSMQVDERCKTCKWAFLCRGGCRRDREPMVDGRLSLNYFCEAYYGFFEYAVPRLRTLIR